MLQQLLRSKSLLYGDLLCSAGRSVVIPVYAETRCIRSPAHRLECGRGAAVLRPRNGFSALAATAPLALVAALA